MVSVNVGNTMDILAELQKRLERRGEDIRLTLSLTSITNLFYIVAGRPI